MKIIALPRALAILILLPVGAQATPILSAVYANNDQTFGPLDTVTILVDVINSGDMSAVTTPGRFPTLNNWDVSFGGPYDFSVAPVIPIVYLAGTTTSIEFFQMSSTAGAPVGNYFMQSASLRFFQLPPIPLGEFRWSVVGVPEPTTLSLLGAGLIGFGLTRRRKLG